MAYQYSQKTTNASGQAGLLEYNVLPSGLREERFTPDAVLPPQQPPAPKAVVTQIDALKTANETVNAIDKDAQELQQQAIQRLNTAQTSGANTAVTYDPKTGKPYIAGVLNPEQYQKAFASETETPQTPQTPAQTAEAKLEAEKLKYTQEAETMNAQLISGLKAENALLVQNISDRYTKAIDEVTELNKSVLAGLTQAGIRAGRQRYATEMEIENIAETQKKGQQRIKDLMGERDNLIAQARQAATNKEIELAYNLLEKKRQAEKDMQTAISEEYKNAIELEKLVQSKTKEARETQQFELDYGSKKADLLAPTLLDYLTGNEESDLALIEKVAEAQDIPVLYLASAIDSLKATKEKDAITTEIKEFNFENKQRLANGQEPYKTLEEYRAATKTVDPTAQALKDLNLQIAQQRLEDMQRKASEPKPATVAQQTVAGYASRMEQAESTFKSLESSISQMNYASFLAQSKLPSAFQSSEIQQYNQAARNFINAKLRQESGAAIAESEFENARQQYLPQPGDSEATLKLKASNRKLVFESMKQAAGTAFSSVDELMGDIQGEVYVSPEGVEYVRGEDGLYYPK